MQPIIIFSDDLTGANDTAVQFTKKGILSTVLISDLVNSCSNMQHGVFVINTDTRAVSGDHAYRKVAELASQCGIKRFPIVYKKIDSTLRGNIGAEIDAIFDQDYFDFAVVAPAYLEKGRSTLGGYHLVENILLENTETARDPRNPVSKSYIPDLIAEQSRYKVGLIDIRFIRNGLIMQNISEQVERGVRIFVLDSVSEDDLDSIAEVLLEQKKRILWVGSAGLAGAISSSIYGDLERESDISKGESSLNSSTVASPILVLAGSMSEVTRQQIEYLRSQSFDIISFDPLHLLDEESFTLQLDDRVREAAAILSSCRNVVITIDQSPENRENIQTYSARNNLGKQSIGESIARSLGRVGAQLIRTCEVKGAVMTGGDIAIAACRELGIKALEILDQVEEGIPLSRSTDPELSKVLIATKAGAFGSHTSLFEAVRKIACS